VVLDADAVETAARAFREARQLYTVAETEAWLAGWGITIDNWLKYMHRSVLRQQWADQLPDLVARYPAAESHVRQALKIVGICSGHLARIARWLAGRAAIHERPRNQDDRLAPDAEPPQAAPPDAMDPARSKLFGLAPERLTERCEVLARLTSSFERFRKQLLTAQAIRHRISARHTDWICMDCLSDSFADESAAHEAALCVRQDGEDLHQVAAWARTVVRPQHFRLGELEPELHGPFLSARKGELLGPLPVGPAFRLFLVRDKILPSEKDPATRQRAEQVLLQDLLDREIALRVEWHQRLD
jgi:hypothetical protein